MHAQLTRQLGEMFDSALDPATRCFEGQVGGHLAGDRTPDALVGPGSPEPLVALDGARVPLGQVGRLEVCHEEVRYKRMDRERFVAVQGELEGAQAVDVTEQLIKTVDAAKPAAPPAPAAAPQQGNPPAAGAPKK